MVNTIWYRFDLIKFRKYFSVESKYLRGYYKFDVFKAVILRQYFPAQKSAIPFLRKLLLSATQSCFLLKILLIKDNKYTMHTNLGSRRFFQQLFRLQILRHKFSNINFPTQIFRHQIFRQTNFSKPHFPTTNFPIDIFSDNTNYFSIQRTNRNKTV